jgi:fused signal recognition particle receptor
MRLEDERIAKEKAEAARRQEAEAQAAEKERLRMAEEEAARAKSVEDQARSLERAAREEEARLIAMQQAIVVKARVEAESRALAESRAKDLARYEGLAAQAVPVVAKEDRTVKVAAAALFTGIVATLLMAGAVYAVAIAPKGEAEKQVYEHRAEEAQRAQQEEHDKRVRAESTADDLQKRIHALEEEAARAKKPDAPAGPKPPTAGPVPYKPPTKKDPNSVCVNSHDPLCGDLNMK